MLTEPTQIINKKERIDITVPFERDQRIIGFNTPICFASRSSIVKNNATIRMFSTVIKIHVTIILASGFAVGRMPFKFAW